jgi:hypothetical protein
VQWKVLQKRALDQSRRTSKEWRFRVDLHAHPHDDRVARLPCIPVKVERRANHGGKSTGRSKAELLLLLLAEG